MSKDTRQRYVLLDVLRGLCLISMTAYHAMYDVVEILGVPVSWFWTKQGYIWQQSICWTFILLSGFCFGLSRSPLKRGLITFGASCVVTLVTYIAMPSELIICGVLTLLGLSQIILALVKMLFEKLGVSPAAGKAAAAGLVISAALFFVLRGMPQGYLGFEGLTLLKLPEALYRYDTLSVFGFTGPTFRSSDYFPLIPWFFLYLTGHFLQRRLGGNEKIKAFLRCENECARRALSPLSFLGRHSLLIYLLHQPLLMAVFTVFLHFQT